MPPKSSNNSICQTTKSEFQFDWQKTLLENTPELWQPCSSLLLGHFICLYCSGTTYCADLRGSVCCRDMTFVVLIKLWLSGYLLRRQVAHSSEEILRVENEVSLKSKIMLAMVNHPQYFQQHKTHKKTVNYYGGNHFLLYHGSSSILKQNWRYKTNNNNSKSYFDNIKFFNYITFGMWTKRNQT